MSDSASTQLFEPAERILSQLVQYLDESRSSGTPAITLTPIARVADELALAKWIRSGGMTTADMVNFIAVYLRHTIRMHHPKTMGHQVSAPHYGASIADMVHGVVNNPMGIYEMGPSAATTETIVVRWMLEKLGWLGDAKLEELTPADGAGVLTHGGSLANLTALLGARAAAQPDAWQEGVDRDLVILAPKTSHYSVARAASIMGLGARAVIALEVDENEVIVVAALARALEKVQHEGKRVMAVVANACATATGLYDPIDAIADFCEAHNLWLHVDGAHGLSAILSQRERHRLRGIERAHSTVWDAHKMLRTSTLCAAVLFRDANAMSRVFAQDAPYLFHERESFGVDILHNTLECTKAGLGLKLFLVLATLGERGLADYIDAQYDKARRFAAIIDARPPFECPYTPQSNILCFRYGKDSATQLRIRDALIRQGTHYITSAEIRGERYLRLSLMVPETGESDLITMLDAIETIAAQV